MDFLRGTKKKFLRLFRHRQIYHRSDGVVHFVEISPKSQIVIFSLFFAFITWVGFTTVNVIFQEQIIHSKETAFRQLNTFYTTKLKETEKINFDLMSLNSFLQDHFDQTINDVKNRHKALEQVVAGVQKTDQTKEEFINELSKSVVKNTNALNKVMVSSFGNEPTLRQSRIDNLRSQVKEEISFYETDSSDPSYEIKKAIYDSYDNQLSLLTLTEEKAHLELLETESLIKMLSDKIGSANLAKNKYNRKSNNAIGGPLISIDDENRVFPIFIQQAERTANTLNKLDKAIESLKYIPLGEPIIEKRRTTSGFGSRTDPFTKRKTLHLGLDFTSKYAAPIRATASGVVSYSGVKGGFGNVIEIDHGNGLMTRYAHLSRRKVTTGQRVEINDVVGLLGSTGRSTAPHLHYELRLNGKAMNPKNFMGAGKYVYQK